MRCSVLCMENLLRVRVLGEGKKENVEGLLSDLYPEPIRGLGRLACFFQLARPEVGAFYVQVFEHVSSTQSSLFLFG